MEIIGLISNIILQQDANFKSYQYLQQSKEAIIYNNGLQTMLNILKDIKLTRNINAILKVEELFLHQELKDYANSPEEVGSIKKAVEQLQEAKESLNIVKDAEKYQAATATYSSKNKEDGLPLDSFRQFLKSHATRIGNRMTSPLSMPEKDILRQRKENLGMVGICIWACSGKPSTLFCPKSRNPTGSG